MARLPVVGSDINAWGTVLNAYLQAGHNADGSHRVAELTADYGVSRSNTAATNTTAIQQAFSDVTTLGNAKFGYAIHLAAEPSGLPYPVNTLTLPSEPVTFYGDGPVLSVLGTTSGTLLTYNPAVAPLTGTGDPWSQNNTGITSGIHYRSNSWDIFNLGFTKTDNWSGNTGDLVSFPKWTSGAGNLLVPHLMNLLITNANGGGLNIQLDGVRAENQVHQVQADGCAGVGITLPSDTVATNCQSNNNAGDGFLISGSATVLTGWKCYNNGGTAGMHIINGNGGTIATAGYTQDNFGPGVYVKNGQNIKVEAIVDRNCWNGSTVDSTKQAGAVLDGGYGCDLEIIATDSWAGAKANGQLHAILVKQTDGTNGAFSTNQKNRVRAIQTQTQGASNTVLATLDPNSVTDGCLMIVDGVELPRVKVTNAPGATPSMNSDLFDLCRFTGLAAAITSMTTNLTGTPVDGQILRASFTDNGTGRAITWGASFESSTVSLPTTTVANARLDVTLIWNPATSKWRCISSA